MNKDFDIPPELSSRGIQATQIILGTAAERYRDGNQEELSGGGCRAFYTPHEWSIRGELYGLTSELIVCHDGGDLAPMFNLDYQDYAGWWRLFRYLLRAGFNLEQATSWYSCIYDEREGEKRY